MRVAAVDVGTNTVRLLVADVGPDRSLRDVERSLEITRLGQGVDASGGLHPDAVSRTLDAIASAVSAARSAGAEAIRVAGTSALRDARDREEFRRAVRERTGCDLDVITGADEGRLTFLGASLSGPSGARLVCDIGGGSTEFVRGSARVAAVHSMDVGSVRVRERFLTNDPPSGAEVDAAVEAIDHGLRDAEDVIGAPIGHELVGVAGTVTTLAALVLGSPVYDRDAVDGARLRDADVASWSRRLLSMHIADVKRLPTMHPGRADVIAAGVLILRRVMDRWAFGSVVVSERDILDGLVLELASEA